MPEETLLKLRRAFPNARLKQTYGLSETGTLRSKSQSDNSVWVKVGGDGFDVKVVDDVLWVRAAANMVGYLNAPNPFDAEGWLCTGDRVEVDGEYMRILGRDSDIINVGGQKVFPAEVENVLLQAPGVSEASVFGSRHPLMGSVVNARVSLDADEERDAAIERLRRHCRDHLAKYKVPVRFEIVQAEAQHSARYKKLRQPVS
jgi:acyl-CoA synthetase (AMP-forming)/AMP-acid ligase II